MSRQRSVTRVWTNTPEHLAQLTALRHDVVAERAVTPPDEQGPNPTELQFEQQTGPFAAYRRRLVIDTQRIEESTTYRLTIPWFGGLFALPVRARIRGLHRRENTPWWAPPDLLTARQVLVLGLLAALSMVSAFTNTLFTQTVTFAADDFGVDNTAIGVAGAIVRAGIVITIPLAIVSDRIGRRRVITWVVWIAPITAALGAVAPTFGALVATQTVSRPLGLVLDFLVAVMLAEEMPRNSRAYAVSLTAMVAAFGAGFAVMALPLADLGPHSWRLIYLVSLIWLGVAYDATRRLPETVRFTAPHRIAPPIDRRRFALLAVIAIAANFFVAPASFFQNRYLADIRHFDASRVALFTIVTATPAGLGFAIGGRLADQRGRRLIVGVLVPVATALMVASFAVSGFEMWVTAFGGAFLGGVAFPALAVYRTELFPTGNRGRAAGLLTVVTLLSGMVALVLVGALLDAGWSYQSVMSVTAVGELLVAVIVVTMLPETAHRTLEEINPEDETSSSALSESPADPNR